MRIRLWPALALLVTSPALAAGGGGITKVETVGSRGLVFAEIGLPGGIGAQMVIEFEDVTGLSDDSLALSAELVDPEDKGLNARLPAGTFIPSDFPVLVRINALPLQGFSFRGPATLELVTDNLQFSGHTPFRLFRAPTAGAFQDITQGLGFGSFRVRGAGGSFSDFLIAADLRPFRQVNRVKLQRLLLLAQLLGEFVEAPEDFTSLLEGAQTSFESGDVAGAFSKVDAFVKAVREESAIPADSRPADGVVGLAGLLRAAADSLRHSLALQAAAPPEGTGGVTTSFTAPGGLGVDAKIIWNDAFQLDLEDLGFEAELVDPRDPQLLQRFPPGVRPAEALPLLFSFDPTTSEDVAFSGAWTLELTTDNLDFRPGSPLRLFKAPDGGAFEDITMSLGLGSFRVRGAGGSFSELMIAEDFRSLEDVVIQKLLRFQEILDLLGHLIDAETVIELQQFLDDLVSHIEAGQIEEAVAHLEALIVAIDEHAGGNIPALWRSSDPASNAAGELASTASSIKFNLSLLLAPEENVADVNRDGQVDVGDVLFLINLVFGGSAAQ